MLGLTVGWGRGLFVDVFDRKVVLLLFDIMLEFGFLWSEFRRVGIFGFCFLRFFRIEGRVR